MRSIDTRTTEAAELTKKALNQVADDLAGMTGRVEVHITAGYLRLAAHVTYPVVKGGGCSPVRQD